jgi:hypothetical protein
VFNGDEVRVKKDVELLVVKMRQEYKIKGKIELSKNDVFTSLDAYLSLVVQNHEQSYLLKSGQVLTPTDGSSTGIIMRERIQRLADNLGAFFHFYDSDEFKDIIYNLQQHIMSLTFIYEDKLELADPFNSLLTINENYLSTKQFSMPKF